MVEKYIYNLNKEINKFYYSNIKCEYKPILERCIYKIKKIPKTLNEKEKTKIKDAILSIILATSLSINKYEFDDYIKILKENKIYKYKTKKNQKIFMRFFLRQYLILYMIKYNKVAFLKNKSSKRKLINILKGSKNFFAKILPWNLYVDYVELVVTTKCTLKCKNCANLMYKYKKPYDVELDIIIKSIKKLFECSNQINTFRILGGEPFCNPKLKTILKQIPSKKVKKIVIVTNGTLIPKDPELIKIIKEKGIIIEISDYGIHSYNKEKLINFLDKNNIKYHSEINKIWFEYGDLIDYKRNEQELEKQFTICNINCKSILNGKLYYCPRAANGHDLGILKEKSYVELIENDKKTNKKEIKKLMFRNNSIEACKYCKYATKECIIVPVAEQLKNR